MLIAWQAFWLVLLVRWVYLEVVRTLTWPRIFCSSMRSTPASSKWVAKLWRNEWHEIFFYAELFDNGLHGGLDAPSIKWRINQMGIFQPSFPTGKDEKRMSVQLPEMFKNLQCGFWKRNQPVFVALGVADMYPHVFGVDVAHGKVNAFPQTQAHAVDGKEEDFIA